jgi:pyridine nucleotide-disulfide oxidoreductase family protein
MKHLVLLGGGHAHVQVLQDLARAPLAGAEVVMVTPFARQMYSGMVPGLVAGHYTADQCAIPLLPLAQAARVPLVEDAVVQLDASARSLRLTSGQTLNYDVLSLDTGSVMDRDRIPGAREHGLFVRPIEHFVRLLDPLLALAAQRVLDVVVIGGGAAGVELAMALQVRLSGRGDERARVALVTGGPPPLFGYPQTVIERGLRALARRRITVFHDSCARIAPGALHLDSGARLACDAPIIATGGDAPAYLAGSGLQLDARGFVLTGPTLQTLSHPEVLAAGDVATRDDTPHPRSGVYAVRAGPPLAANLRALVQGGTLLPHQPQRRTLNLLSCGDGRAIASYGGWSAQGRWAWWWKDRIDRGFIARYGSASASASASASVTPADRPDAPPAP